MFTEKITQAQQLITESVRPLIIFDDDPDGLASFLLMYKKILGGNGIPLKGNDFPVLCINILVSFAVYSPSR